MSFYNKIVVAIDPFINSKNIISKAQKLLANKGVLDMVYVSEEVPVVFAGAPLTPPLAYVSDTREHKIEAQKLLIKLSKKHVISEERIHILIGSTSQEIISFAKKYNADCIVIGSHGRHGVTMLLGSTTSNVIHGSPCDVVVIKM